MHERTRELIAIGALVGAHCQPCLAWHVDKARELGIDDETIREAIEEGTWLKRALSTMRKFFAEILTQAAPETAFCSGDKKRKGLVAAKVPYLPWDFSCCICINGY